MSRRKKSQCRFCEVELDKTVLGLNKKLLGRKILSLYCIDCLANYLEISTEELLDMAEEFKLQGCVLFE